LGKTVLLHGEQGLGDTIQFCRFAPLVSRLGACVVLEVQPPLKTLIEELDWVHLVVGRGEPLPRFDVQCPLLSLPLAFETTLETIPGTVPYLRATADRVSHWRARLGNKGARRLGLVWSGNAMFASNHKRSMSLSQLEPLLSLDVELVSLQKNVGPEDARWLADHPQVRHFGGELQDFAATAALTSLMDVVVSVDTSVAHLAGALGKPTWILLPLVPDWRWLLHRADSPWYPTARLFRQTQLDDWGSVVDKVIAELCAYGAGSCRSPSPGDVGALSVCGPRTA
jgi:hypothetical protein